MTDAIFSGILLGLALVFSVGPVIFTIIKLRINYGLVAAFYFISGVWLSDIIWVITANLFSELIGKLIVYRTIIGICGGCLLIGIGTYYLFFKKYHTKEQLDNEIIITSSTHLRLFITGFLINTLNPGVIALWFAATTKSLSNTIDQRLTIFTICLSLNMFADVLKINLAGKLRKKLTDRNIRIISRISGLLFFIFGLVMIGVTMTKPK